MFVGFSGDINCNLLRKSDLRLERVFRFSPHISYIVIIQRSSFLLSKRDSISPYDSFSSSVVLSNVFFLFDPKIYKLLLFNWIIIRLLRNISFFFIFSVICLKNSLISTVPRSYIVLKFSIKSVLAFAPVDILIRG